MLKLDTVVRSVQVGYCGELTRYVWEVRDRQTCEKLASGLEREEYVARNKADKARIALSGICG